MILFFSLDLFSFCSSSLLLTFLHDTETDSDAYGISGSGSGYDMYAPLNTHLYGRMRAQLHANGQVVSSAKSSNSKVTGGKSSSGGNNANVTTAVTSNGNSNSKTTNGNRRTNDKPSSGLKKTAPPPSALIYPNERYATEWDWNYWNNDGEREGEDDSAHDSADVSSDDYYWCCPATERHDWWRIPMDRKEVYDGEIKMLILFLFLFLNSRL